MATGKVYLVGAGPGDAGLITVRGAELLAAADCVLYDSLANETLLASARADAELISVGKRSGAHSFTQDQINSLLVEKAREHRILVRLKGGDPCVFGRGGEEARTLADAGIDFEIVPGVTAAIAAAEYAGMMLTDRQYSSQLLFVTGHEAPGKTESGIDWELLARFRGSIAFYMGLAALRTICSEFLARDAERDLPVCVIESATLPGQRVVRGTISDISEKVTQANIGSPALIIVGKAAAGEPALDWFARRPLRGLRIVLTRDASGNSEFAAEVSALGGMAVPFESMRFRRLTGSDSFIAALATLSSYDWLVFTSARGVDAFFESIADFGKDARVLGGVRLACVGAETGGSLARFGLRPDFVPSVSTGLDLAKQLIAAMDITGNRFLLLRSALAEPGMADLLKAAGASVDDVACYTSEPAGTDGSELAESLKAGAIDWVTFTSGSAVRAFLAAVDPAQLRTGKARIASIGPVTSAELVRRGLTVAAEAKEHTTGGMLTAIIEAEGRR
jgi:uroporphyrinogen III methyltransferase / synthase